MGVPCAGIVALGDTISTPGPGSNFTCAQFKGFLSFIDLSFAVLHLC